MTSSRSRGLYFLCAALGLVATPAWAGDDPVALCIDASDKGLDLRKQGKLIEARRVLAACAAAACGADVSVVCQKRIADISAVLPTIVFSPKDGAGNDVVGVRMTIDGAPTGEPLDGRPITLDPGPHAFTFEIQGHPKVERSFVMVEGVKGRQERIDMVAPPVVGSATGPAPAPPAPASGSGRKTAGFVVGAVGLAGVAAGSVFGLLASSKWSASKNDCSSPMNCPNHGAAVTEHDAAVTDGTVSTIAFAAGGAALVTAAVLFLTAPRASAATVGTNAPLHVEANVAPGTAGLTVVGVFR
jgi:hypothetical protein